MSENNIVFTGGHAGTTALVVAGAIKKRNLGWNIFWIGPKRAMEGKDIETLESKIFPESGISFRPIIAGRLQRKFTRYTISALLKIPIGFIQALILLLQIKPKVILSFGGYAAFPVVVVGKLLGIPILIHEQTAAVGRANKYSAVFATKIALSKEDSLKYFPPDKSVVTGNPILPEIAKILAKKTIGNPPLIFITGGSRGSVTINELIAEVLEKLLGSYRMIHQTGELEYKKFQEKKGNLPTNLKENYGVFASVLPDKMPEILSRADIVVARAGANTVSEIIAAKKPSVLIPIPFSYLDEQTKNAHFAESLGLARVLPQAEASGARLLSEINYLLENWEKISEKASEIQSPDKNAAGKVVDLLEGLIKK